jgi:hypothetical protein
MSDIDFRLALRGVRRTLAEGARTHPPHAPDYWLKLGSRTHVIKAAVHLEKWLLGLSDEDHLAHALVRLSMALELRERNGSTRNERAT